MDQLVDFWQSYSRDIVKAIIGVVVVALLARFGSAIKAWFQGLFDCGQEKRYRKALRDYTEFLPFKSLRDSVKLRDIFVEPRLELRRAGRSDEMEAQASTKRQPEISPDAERGVKSLPLWRALSTHDRLFALGEPGIGKSTLLRYLAACTAGKDRHDDAPALRDILPILVPLPSVKLGDEDDPVAPLIRACSQLIPGRAEGFVRRQLHRHRCLLLFDALDEVGDPKQRKDLCDWIERLVSRCSGNRFVIACRGMARDPSPAAGFQETRIERFSPDQVRECVRKWCAVAQRDPQDGDRLAEKLRKDRGLFDPASTPLLLSLIFRIWNEEGNVPTRRAELYQQFADFLLQDLEKQKGKEIRLTTAQCGQILGRVALGMHKDHTEVAPREQVEKLLVAGLKELGVGLDQQPDYLRYLVERVPFLRDRGMARWGFSHFTFQEYFAAYSLSEDADAMEFLIDRRFDPWWREVILLFAGRRDPSDLVKRLLAEREDIFKSSLFLAGMCIADAPSVGPAVREETAKGIEALYWDGEFKCVCGVALEVLAVLKDESVLRRTIAKAGSHDFYARHRAATVLGAVGGENALESLFPLLEDEQSFVRASAAEALGNIGGERAFESLICLLKDKDYSVRGHAARALGNIAGERALESLFPLLRDEALYVRWSAAGAVGNVGGEKALEGLTPLLEDDDPGARWGAAMALGRMGGEKASESLLPLLKDADCYVRGGTARALGNIGGQEALERVTPLLRDKDSFVRGSAAYALGHIGGERASENLIPLLGDADHRVRVSAAEAIGRIGGERALESLIPLLRDKDSSVRQDAAEALGKIGGNNALEPLIPLLNDVDYFVRGDALLAVGRIGGGKAFEVLIPLLKDGDFDVRSSAASALKQICAREGLVIYDDGQVERIEDVAREA